MKILNWLYKNVFATYDVKLDKLVNELLRNFHKAYMKPPLGGKTELKLLWDDIENPVMIIITEIEKQPFMYDHRITIKMVNHSGEQVFGCTKHYSNPVDYHWNWGSKIQESTIEKIILLYNDYINSYHQEY